MHKIAIPAFALFISLLVAGCSTGKNVLPSNQTNPTTPTVGNVQSNAVSSSNAASSASTNSTAGSSNAAAEGSATVTGSDGKNDSVQTVSNPNSILVLVNKHFALAPDYRPSDLIDDPNLPFIFSGYDEKRLLRKEAALALEKLIAGAKKDGIYLAGVSGYRSYATQKAVFDSYVQQDGEEKARTYSALPGTSEHETGLAIDLSGTDGKCAADDCFNGSKEANWIAQHASEYGYIVRYPKGKENITGYEYESWHIRYVGTNVSKEIAAKGSTLEEYLSTHPAN